MMNEETKLCKLCGHDQIPIWKSGEMPINNCFACSMLYRIVQSREQAKQDIITRKGAKNESDFYLDFSRGDE